MRRGRDRESVSPGSRRASSRSRQEASIETRDQQSHRMFACLRCRNVVTICTRCDRGQVYCGDECRRPARAEQLREARRRYAASASGRASNAERQRRHRERRLDAVTHHGSSTGSGRETSALLNAATVVAELPNPQGSDDQHSETSHVSPYGENEVVRCSICGQPCGTFTRLGFLPPPKRESRRRPKPRDAPR